MITQKQYLQRELKASQKRKDDSFTLRDRMMHDQGVKHYTQQLVNLKAGE